MREILFRAKNLYSNEWVDGFLVASKCNTYPDGFEMITNEGINHDELDDYQPDFLSFHVKPETVGQFTGLTDKNGKKIFEGDVVHILGNQDVEDWKNVDYNALIAFIDGGFCAIDGTIEEHGFRRYALARMDFGIEVIGNIHDNPELLENS